MQRRILACSLILALLFGFVGCSRNQTSSLSDEWEVIVNETEIDNTVSGEQSGQNSVSGNGVSQGDSTATVGISKNEDFLNGLKGLVINITTQQAEKPTRGTNSGDRYYAILSKVAKKYGATINYLNSAGGDSALQTSILSGKPTANVIGIQDYNYIHWINAGVAADLNVAMKKTGITLQEDWYNKDATKIGNLNGSQLAFSSGIYEPFMLIYNKRMIQEKGLTDPIKLYNEGKWNFDKFTEYILKLKETASDGTVSVYGLGTIDANTVVAYAAAMNGSSIIKLNNGKLENNMNAEKTKTALKYVSKWYSVDKSAVAYGGFKEVYKKFAQGENAMIFSTKYVFDAINEFSMNDAVGAVPFPYGPDGSKSTEYVYNQIFMNIIPKCSEKEAAEILFVMNEVYKEIYNARKDDFADNYRTLIRDNDSYNMFKDFSFGNKSIKMSYYNLSGMVYDEGMTLLKFSSAISGGTAVETAIKTYSTQVDTGMSELWGKWKIK